MLTPEVVAAANAILALCFFTIAALVFVGLWRERQAGFNALGTATALIFFTCASGHTMHAEHYLLSPEVYAHDHNLWHQGLVDILTIIPAIAYLAQRRRYGLVIRGQHALLHFERRLSVAEALRSIGEDIAAQTDLEDVLRHVTHHARMLLGADYTAVVTVDQAGKQQCETAGILPDWNDDAWRAAVFLTPSGAAGSLLRSRQPVMVGNLLGLTASAQEEYAVHLAQGARAILAVPISRGTEVIGSLVAGYRQARGLTDDDRSKMAALASQAAVAVENARLIEGLRQAVEARDEFLSVAAHELKTPIASLRGFAQLMARHLDKGGTSDSTKFNRGIQVVDQQSQKLSLLVSQLLDVSRIEAGRLMLDQQKVDIGELAQAVAEHAQLISTKHHLRVHVEQTAMAFVDPLRIEQVIRNLVENAIKYSPRGGDIDIEVEKPSLDTVCLIVRDHGIGIPEEQWGHLFERYYRANENDRTSGMGLGLYISQHIVNLHGGKIELDSPADGGARFIVTLPTGGGSPPEQSVNGDAAWGAR